jgi:hypothetical protein
LTGRCFDRGVLAGAPLARDGITACFQTHCGACIAGKPGSYDDGITACFQTHCGACIAGKPGSYDDGIVACFQTHRGACIAGNRYPGRPGSDGAGRSGSVNPE